MSYSIAAMELADEQTVELLERIKLYARRFRDGEPAPDPQILADCIIYMFTVMYHECLDGEKCPIQRSRNTSTIIALAQAGII